MNVVLNVKIMSMVAWSISSPKLSLSFALSIPITISVRAYIFLRLGAVRIKGCLDIMECPSTSKFTRTEVCYPSEEEKRVGKTGTET